MELAAHETFDTMLTTTLCTPPLQALLHIHACIALVDAPLAIDDSQPAPHVCAASILVLHRIDLVAPRTHGTLLQRLRERNPTAPILTACFGQVLMVPIGARIVLHMYAQVDPVLLLQWPTTDGRLGQPPVNGQPTPLPRTEYHRRLPFDPSRLHALLASHWPLLEGAAGMPTRQHDFAAVVRIKVRGC